MVGINITYALTGTVPLTTYFWSCPLLSLTYLYLPSPSFISLTYLHLPSLAINPKVSRFYLA
ncbi:hypothetical protein P154DRAFT_522920 [Amniculicola lignicola CBS 123094]|uniref:Uncharacterized protein n=1 Tax=Amniculicola lignicola CBS 123094 TaxID=1392246 RepID=A0A6A5WFJ4_9PLEO|nr:hypothetical protein P154DRAFT_522920 [Amniculicola lignicola CBS 123094]